MQLLTDEQVQRKHVYDLRQLMLLGDLESCSQHIFHYYHSAVIIKQCGYIQAVVDEIVISTVDPAEHPSRWKLDKMLREFFALSGELLKGISEDDLRNSVLDLYGSNSVDIINFYPPNLPQPPNTFRGIWRKNASLERWLNICSDYLAKNGEYRSVANLLRKYLGDFLIASYLNVTQESGNDDTYIKEIKRAVLVKSLDCFGRDHLVNMNRLSSTVNVRSFGHRNPLEEYNIDGCRFFISMLSATRRLTVESLMRYWSLPTNAEEIYI